MRSLKSLLCAVSFLFSVIGFPEGLSFSQDRSGNPRVVSENYALADVVANSKSLAPSAVGKPSEISRQNGDVRLSFDAAGIPKLNRPVDFEQIDQGKYVISTSNGERVYLTPDPNLQRKAEQLLESNAVPWGAIVAIDPRSGRVLALASHSTVEPGAAPVALRATFPAASLFKLITASAALEEKSLSPVSRIFYRGGDYTLNKRNYLPNSKLDKRSMSFAQALGKSCNPVFGRISLQQLSASILNKFASRYWFNRDLMFSLPLEQSSFVTPSDDYELALTGAGFGPVTVSPVHAAVMVSAIANHGKMMLPQIVESVVNEKGQLAYQARQSQLGLVLPDRQATTLLDMMESTVKEGTARKQFRKSKSLKQQNFSVAGKTGTLSGENPKGRYHWFVAAAPSDNPEIALAALVIDRGNARINGTGLGRQFLEYYVSVTGREKKQNSR